MKMRLIFKWVLSLVALSFPCVIQARSANEEYQGVQGRLEHLGSKHSRDLRDHKSEGSSLEVRVSGLNKQEPPYVIQRSQSYNPATEFFRTGLSFEATSVSAVGRTTNTPPDSNGAIGPQQYIYALNQEIKSFDRRTGQPDEVIDSQMSYFFGVNAVLDPHILYDHFSKAWYVIAMTVDTGPGGRDLLFAMCRDCVITDCSVWDFYRMPNALFSPGTPARRIDYPLISFDTQAVYIDTNVLDSNTALPTNVSIVVIQKESLFKGDPLITVFPLAIINPSDPTDTQIFYSPAINFDEDPDYGYFIHRSVSSSDQIYTNLHLLRVINPGSSQPTLSAPIAIPVPPYAAVANFNLPPVAGNVFPNLANRIDVGGLLTNCVVRCGQLYLVTLDYTDNAGSNTFNPDRLALRWWQIDLTGDAKGCGKGVETPVTVPTCIQSSLLYDNSSVDFINYSLGSVAVNKLGDLVITGSVYGESTFTNIIYAARKKNDPLNTLRNPIFVTQNSATPYNFGLLLTTRGQRWGDYSSIFVDPLNDVNFWLTGMYAGVQNGWSIQAAELIRTKN